MRYKLNLIYFGRGSGIFWNAEALVPEGTVHSDWERRQITHLKKSKQALPGVC
jgi:hypothetical protein